MTNTNETTKNETAKPSSAAKVIPENTDLYIVCAVQEKQKAKLEAIGLEQDIKLTWADGMIGVVPVFIDKEKAEIFADNKFEILCVKSTKV